MKHSMKLMPLVSAQRRSESMAVDIEAMSDARLENITNISAINPSAQFNEMGTRT